MAALSVDTRFSAPLPIREVDEAPELFEDDCGATALLNKLAEGFTGGGWLTGELEVDLVDGAVVLLPNKPAARFVVDVEGCAVAVPRDGPEEELAGG